MKVGMCTCALFALQPPRRGWQRGEVSVFPGHRPSGGVRVPVAAPEALLQWSSPESKVRIRIRRTPALGHLLD
eukprot:1385296-Alexandrium_andersonii.AAC.1